MNTRSFAVRYARYSNSRAYIKITSLVTSREVNRIKRIKKEGTEIEALNRLRLKWKKVIVELKRYYKVKGRRIK